MDFLDTLDAAVKAVSNPAGGKAPAILVFYTVKPWEAETGAAVLRAMRARFWNWNGLVVNLRPGEDVASLGPERAHELYQALNAQFEPDRGHTCGTGCPPAV
jgi:hypothetical protein